MPELTLAEEQERRRELDADARLRQEALAADDARAVEVLIKETSLPSSGLTPSDQDRARRANDGERRRSASSRAAAAADAAQGVGATMETLGTAGEGVGRAGEGLSRGLGAASRGAVGAGRGMMAAGAELSATGLGAVVGVPLGIAGGITTGAGVLGQGASAAGSSASRATISASRATRSAGADLVGVGKELSASMPQGVSPEKLAEGVRMGANILQKTPLSPVGDAIEATVDFAEEAKVLLPSITLVGIFLALAQLNYRLVFGNLMRGQYLPAKPMSHEKAWWAITIFLDGIVAIVLGLVLFFLYALVNPCGLIQAGLNNSWISGIAQGACAAIVPGS